MEALGKHILVELYGCDQVVLNDTEKIQTIMNTAASIAGATIVESCFHHFNPYGVSGVVIIQESHLTVHTWPEYQYAAVDLFTCGDSVNPWRAFDYLKLHWFASHIAIKEIHRGFLISNSPPKIAREFEERFAEGVRH